MPIVHLLPGGKDSNFAIDATGCFVHSKGLILTAHHVLEAEDIYVIYKGQAMRATVVIPQFKLTYTSPATHETTVHAFDLGLLSIEPGKEPYPAVPLSDRKDLGIGEPVGVCGYFEAGTGYKIMDQQYVTSLLTAGVVSGQFKIADAKEDFGSRLILNVTAGPGSSGSPVVELRSGKVCGVLTQAWLANALKPGAGPDATVQIPVGIAEAEPVILVRNWIADTAAKIGFPPAP